MSKRSVLLLLEYILDSSIKIKKYTAELSIQDFIEDEKTIDAVVRNFEIIGEASNRIDDDFKTQHPQIEWLRITGLRNRLILEYFGIDLEIIWSITNDYLDDLIKQVEHLITQIRDKE